MKCLLGFLSFVLFALTSTSSTTRAQEDIPTNPDAVDPNCKNGQCPSPSATTATDNNSDNCGIWMGPSPIKHAESHGFGLGLFTGKAIPKGTTIESMYGTAGEVILPLYGSESIHNEHTPLREYVWDENTLPELAIVYPQTMTYQFIPGASSIIPCTNKNFNVDIVGDGKADTPRQSVVADTSLHRARHPAAGAVAARNQAAFVAVRDIAAGEELTARCTDDDFDGGVYYLARYAADSDRLFCVDHTARVDTSRIPGAGKGLFSKRKIGKDETIITTPLVPVHRREMVIDDAGDSSVNPRQLMLNYCWGHENSDLLLLPYGPLVNFINHYGGDDTTTRTPNARIEWHPVNKTAHGNLERRQQHHHHVEMFMFPADTVARSHGVSLTMDIIATREILPGEEIYLDYGAAWQAAWEAHVVQWKAAVAKGELEADYMDAEAFIQAQGGANVPIRTLDEQDDDPYPENIETFCYYSGGQVQDDVWDANDLHECFRPCHVARRYNDAATGDLVYDVHFVEEDNPRIVTECIIDDNYVLQGIPHANVRIVDRPYSVDVLLPTAFRREMQVPANFYPVRWMRSKLRKSKKEGSQQEQEVIGEEFKRKVPTSDATRGVVEEKEIKAVE